ncbi:MAG: lipopolysaccharide biosynthesis protein [Thermoanaerobaculia bacterium]
MLPEEQTAIAGEDAARLAKGAGVLLGGRLVGRGLSFGVQIVLGRLLGPALFGLYAIGWNIFLLLGLLASLGLEHGVVRYGAPLWGADRAAARALARRALALTLLAAAAAALGLHLAAPGLAGLFGKPSLVAVLEGLAVGVLFLPLLRVAAAATRASQRMSFSVAVEDLGQPLLHLGLVALLFALGWRLAAAVWGAVASYLLAALLALLLLARLLRAAAVDAETRIPGRGELLRFSLPTATAGLLAVFVVWSDRLLVGYFLSAAETGIYQAASQVSILFHLLLSSFTGMFAPMIASLHHEGETARLGELFRVTTKWGLYVGLPAFVVIAGLPEDVLAALLGREFVAGAAPMVVLSTAQLVNLATGAVGMLLIMCGFQRRWLALSGTALVLNVLLNLVLIPRFGLLGAAVATLIAVAVLFVGGLAAVRRGLALWPYDRRYSKGLAAALVAAAGVAGVRLLVPEMPWLRLGLAAPLAYGLFVAALLALGLDREDQEFLSRLRRRLGWGAPS